MERQIIFRAWLPTGKKMTKGHSISEWAKILNNVHDDTNSFIDNNVYLQYTGLKDKNGKEIYEGDIVKGRHGVTLVKDLIDFHLYVNDNYHWFTDQEVIGNIYESPDLLNK